MSGPYLAEVFNVCAAQSSQLRTKMLSDATRQQSSALDERWACKLKTCAAAVALALLTACQTPHTFPKPDATWQTRVGQLQYIAEGRAVVGECVVSTRPGDLQLEFSSGPGFPLMRLALSGSTARAEGILARGSWQGQAANAPTPLRGWMRVAREFKPAQRVSILSPETGERFHFVFTN